MSILVINAGSSSIKYSLYESASLRLIDHGLIEEIRDHHEGFEVMRTQLLVHGIDITQINAIGHRVVHGGERFHEPALVDDDLLAEITALIPLAPLHNPANIEGIIAARTIAPNVPNFAIFDTAFHQSMPPHAYRYPLPNDWYESYHVRRYGFHGTSHHYVALQASDILQKPLDEINLITFHIGNGVSACAIERGKSIDTSMGMTPLEGLMMGTRCGSIDPSIIAYMVHQSGMSIEAVDTILNKKSGLFAIAGTNDLRSVINAKNRGDENAILALDMFAYRLRKQLGEYMAVLRGVDAIVFTGGIGEHSPLIHEMVCEGLEHMGIILDPNKNCHGEIQIHDDESSVALLVIATDEERQIATYVKEHLKR
ncbi:acetate kinase [Sulfuricurvum sp.]|uniref:acetate/propionate family kinase n=1 Tax=Sulfuricurvum sp. TaxID=2025608 RepID=UPI002E3676D5|nr:acetate kinase [Sulfuricurvum sp.]HEX5329665.1 acetate kinase [Sulfuricurvum sp.]